MTEQEVIFAEMKKRIHVRIGREFWWNVETFLTECGESFDRMRRIFERTEEDFLTEWGEILD